MPKKSEYELMPVKPLKELKNELQKLKNELKKDDGSAKILVKVLNSNIEIQKKITAMLNEHRRVTDSLRSVVKFFESIETTEEIEEKELRTGIKELVEQNKNLLAQVGELNAEIRRHKYFKERLPRGLSLVYQRTK